jgi:hypothetical protein
LRRNTQAIIIYVKENHFSDIVNALNEKYGAVKPKISVVKNRMGVSFENAKYLWRKTGAVLEAERYGKNLETSQVIYRTDFCLEEFGRRKAESNKQKAGDL